VSGEFIGTAALISRYVVALVLVTAAVPKLVDAREFERVVTNYELLPSRLVRPVALWLPRLELACGLALLLGVAVKPVVAAAGLLLLVFAGAVALNLKRGREIDCGCYGSIAPRRIGWPLVAGDVLLAAIAILAALADPGALALLTVGHQTTSLSDGNALAVLLFSAALVVAYLTISSWQALRRAEGALRHEMDDIR
jgi:uncharacterized membrane protein YphA (DoxX/SURF4 family)